MGTATWDALGPVPTPPPRWFYTHAEFSREICATNVRAASYTQGKSAARRRRLYRHATDGGGGGNRNQYRRN